MTKALCGKLARLYRCVTHYEAIYHLSLEQADRAHWRRRAIEARMFTLLNLSLWVGGQW